MSWKICNIEIKNFKFFRHFSLNTNCKNVLLYGENGSGKSSIFWSIYTHFQACYKNREQAQKYFKVGHAENLRNRYSQNSEESSIKISFDNGNGGIHTIVDSNTAFYSDNESIYRFMRWTTMSSDFINYKFLFSLFDFSNSQENEIFQILEKEALPFLDLDGSLVDINNIDKNNFNADVWWDYIKSTCRPEGPIPKNVGSQNHFTLNTIEYKKIQDIINRFNTLLYSKLSQIVLIANNMLQETFKIDAKILLEYKKAEFNRKISNRTYDGKLHAPKVILKVQMLSNALVNSDPIIHPRSFFNEAKITCMALSLRLAILSSHPSSGDAASVLFIDDLLISLDMPLRRKVIKVLLPYSNRFQMFIMTHDRAFYNMVSNEIDILGEQNNWEKCELYVDEENGVEKPTLIISKNPLEKAKLFLSQHEVSASVNATRRAAEKVLKKLLPNNLGTNTSNLGKSELCSLIDHFNNLKKKIQLPNVAPHLQEERQLLLNPFSHDDIETPFYRNELKAVIKEIEELNKICRKQILESRLIHSTPFLFKMTNPSVNSNNFEGEFVFLDGMSKYVYNGIEYYLYPQIYLTSSSDEHSIKCKEWGLKALYKKVVNLLGYNTQTAPKIFDCIFFKDDGSRLLVSD